MPRSLIRTALLATLVPVSACTIPRFEGPQIQNPPAGFLMQNESYLQRRMFPDLEVDFHTAWVHTDLSGVSVIYVNRHPHRLTLDDILSARAGVEAATADPDTRFGPVDALTIDGREAWGWEERVQSERRGLVDVAYRAVIPYDSATYAIEFVSGEPSFKAASPDTLRTIVSSFAIGRTTWNFPLIAMISGALLLLVSVQRSRSQERRTRHRSINLVKFKKEEGEGEARSEGGPPAPAARPTTGAMPGGPDAVSSEEAPDRRTRPPHQP